MNYPPQQGPPTAYMPPPPEPKKSKKAAGCLGIGCGGLVLIAVIGGIAAAVSGGGKSGSSSTTVAAGPAQATTEAAAPAASKAAAPKKAATPDTVTYIVTGTSNADVQYGTAGSTTQGHVPLKVTKKLGNPLYYSISAQLQGSGKVTCKIEVNGKAISTATASGGYNIAMCEMSKDPLSGDWTDTNQG
ncbi:hypothetical protein [Streptacidiphilus cavernicola]|uniref:MmpS family membrane protein n=1 Tax=Streptacidiphilus cavernicola TaxID=3342716 RepID=A0ABV6VRP2_9ACTN